MKQHRAREHTPVDVGFQSLAGTSSALAGMIGLDVEGLLDLARSFERLYFETGQGSEVTNDAAEGVDMVTLESRTYGVARYIRQQTGAWTIVNDVAGFIGPEVFRTAEQLERTCLEDTVMAKLHGLTMGLDICATFHMGIAPDALRQLTARIAESAAPAYLMAVAGSADPMLGYLTTSFREHPRLRRRLGRQVTSAMHKRLVELDVLNASGEVGSDTRAAAYLYAMYAKGGGDTRTSASLLDEGHHKMMELRHRGWDLGYGDRSTCGRGSSRRDLPECMSRALRDARRRSGERRLSAARRECARSLSIETITSRTRRAASSSARRMPASCPACTNRAGRRSSS